MTKADRDRRYQQSENGRIVQQKKNQKYRSSEKGKEASRRNTLAWRDRNKEKANEKDKEYRKSEHGKEVFRIKTQRYRARKDSFPATLTLNEWNKILDLQNNECAICGVSFDDVRPTQDHITPVSKGGGYTKENIQALCGSCNSRKSNK